MTRRLPGLVSNNREVKLGRLRNDPLLRSIVSKGVRDPNRPVYTDRDGGYQNPEAIAMLALQKAGFTGSDINDYKAIMDMLPDIRRISSLLSNGILSPTDATPTPLTYRIDPGDFPDKGLVGDLVDLVTDYFRNVHKIDGFLKELLEDILFNRGSRPFFILPEASLDNMINISINSNASLESAGKDFDRTLRSFKLIEDNDYLDKLASRYSGKTDKSNVSKGISLESFTGLSKGKGDGFNAFNLRIDGNYQTILRSKLISRLRDERISKKLAQKGGYSLGMESIDGEDISGDLLKALNRDRYYMADHVKTVKPLSKLNKPTVGHAIEFRLPSESVIPLHQPGTPEDHVAYFVLLDEDANPISLTDEAGTYETIQRRTSVAPNTMSSVLSEAYLAQKGGDSRDKAERSLSSTQMEQIFNEAISNYLTQSINDSEFKGLRLSRPNDVYKMLLKRSLLQQNTRLLFVPASMMVYMAFKYNAHGVGKPLLEDVRIPAALRAILNFAHVNGEIRNSIAHTKLNIELDELDPEPEVTVNEIMQQFINMRGGSMVFGLRPADVISQLNQASVEVQVSGNDRYDKTSVEVEDIARDINTPTEELDSRLRDMIYSGLGGVPPELVEHSADVEFAAQYMGAHAQLTKIYLSYQGPFCEYLADYCRKLFLNSSILMRDAINLVKARRGEDRKGFGDDYANMSNAAIVAHLLDRLVTELPAPKGASLEAQMEALGEFSSAIDEVIEYFISEETIGEMVSGEKLAGYIDGVKASIKAKLMRDFVRSNGILPELSAMFDPADDDDIKSIVMEYKDYYDNIRRTVTPLLKVLNVVAQATDEDLKYLDEGDGGGDWGGDDDSGGGDDGGGDDDFGGDMDFGDDLGGDFEDDLGGDDTEEQNEAEEADTESEEAVQDL